MLSIDIVERWCSANSLPHKIHHEKKIGWISKVTLTKSKYILQYE